MKALSSAVWFFVLVLWFPSTASAENYVGIILDGYQKNCVVHSMGIDYDCNDKRQLYAGDKVTKTPDINEVKIKWAPYTTGKELTKTSLMVSFEPPKDKKNIVQGIKDMLGLAKTKHKMFIGATRGGFGDIIPQPGDKATLLPGQETTFACESDGGRYLVFKDSKDREIFKKKLGEDPVVRLNPEEIGMRPDEVYTWKISGSRTNSQFTVRLLPMAVVHQVKADLMKIEKEAMGKVDELIQKALYLQFMSDAYPKEIDMYWLSYTVLETVKDDVTLSNDDRSLIDELRRNYRRHTRERM